MADFPYLDRDESEPLDVQSERIPSGYHLVTAMDRVVLDIAKQHNRGHLVIPDVSMRGQSTSKGFSNGMSPIFFASGVNANPLVTSSNPLDIARNIQTGSYDSQTINRVELFLNSLCNAGKIPATERDRLLKVTRPSREPVFVFSDTGRIKTWYRGVDDNSQFCDEFITYPEERVRNYTILVEDSIVMSTASLQRVQRFSP